MPRIGNAPQGENTSPAGTEKLPLTGSKYATLNTIKTWLQTAFTSVYAAFNHTHADSDNGGVVAHSVLTGAGTSLHVPAYSSDSTTFLSGTGEWLTPAGSGDVYDSDILFTDITTNNSSLTKHGFLPKLSGDSTLYLNGDGEWATVVASPGDVYDSDIIFQDITTGNADSDSHGFLLKLSMNTSHFLRADGSWQAPPAGGTVYDSDVVMQDITTNNATTSAHGFLPKLSGDSTNYLNGDGEWTTPSGGVTMDQADPYGIFHRLSGSSSDDDEFSTNTIADYTAVAPTGTATWAVANGVVSCTFTGQTANDICCILKAMTLADGAWWETNLRMISGIPTSTRFSMAGLVVTDGVLTTSNALAAIYYISSAGALTIDLWKGTLTNMATGINTFTLSPVIRPESIRLQLKRTASNNWNWLIGNKDGAQMSSFGTTGGDPAFTPTHAGLFATTWGGSHTGIVSFDFIRHMS